MNEFDAEKNARLLIDLKENHDAKGLGSISGFFDTHVTWRCPGCLRDKSEIARLDKNDNLLCAIHYHHDHFQEAARSALSQTQLGNNWGLISESLVRFPYTRICNDCNVIEPYAKDIVGAPAAFSFAPYEIALFIRVKNNAAHTLNAETVREVYEAALPTMTILGKRLRAIRDAINDDTGEFEHISEPVMRVIKSLRTGDKP